MKTIGVTTVGRWISEELPKDMLAFMLCHGMLYRLKRFNIYNGVVQPVLATLLDYALGGEFIPRGKYTLHSPVFLTLGEDLAGLRVERIIDSAAPAATSGCWAMKDEILRGNALDEHYALQKVAREQEADVSVPHCG